jgi:hypothetical protein
MSQKELLFIFLYLIVFIIVILVRKNEWHILFVLFITLLVVIMMFPEIKWKIPIIMTIIFCTIENICVYYGLWKYQNFTYGAPYVPIWLYLAWLLSILFIVKFSYKTFVKKIR